VTGLFIAGVWVGAVVALLVFWNLAKRAVQRKDRP